MAFSIRAESSTVRVIGPTVSIVQLRGNTPFRLTLPNVGFSPTIPHKAEGILIEPPVSVPREAIHCPAATDEADPPLEPPVIRSVSHGFRAGPSWGLILVAPKANSCICSFPTTIAPASFSLLTTIASFLGTRLRYILDPTAVVIPAVSYKSLSPIGMP